MSSKHTEMQKESWGGAIHLLPGDLGHLYLCLVKKINANDAH
jgi:hypothetical protein